MPELSAAERGIGAEALDSDAHSAEPVAIDAILPLQLAAALSEHGSPRVLAELAIELEDRTVRLQTGDVFVVPRGVRHHPIAEHKCLVLLIEKKTTQHTGREVTAQTRSLADQLRSL